MLSNQASARSAVSLLAPGEKANTAAATGSWVSVAGYEGDIEFVQSIGTVTAGSITGKIQTADDGSGTNAADVTGAGFTAITTSNDPAVEKIRVDRRKLGPYVRYLGTIATGPADACAVMLARPKTV